MFKKSLLWSTLVTAILFVVNLAYYYVTEEMFLFGIDAGYGDVSVIYGLGLVEQIVYPSAFNPDAPTVVTTHFEFISIILTILALGVVFCIIGKIFCFIKNKMKKTAEEKTE